MNYTEKNITSIGWLNCADGSINLTPCINGAGHATKVNVSKEEYNATNGEKPKMIALALKHLNAGGSNVEIDALDTHKGRIDHFERNLSKCIEHHGLISDYTTLAFYELQAAKMGMELQESYEWGKKEMERVKELTLSRL
ncbi:hypothetical protein [Vibrio sp. Hal054]|uniref:hypothetical protein n=1 Tax=Vibrio sp. Hal054 TaxID=3035158 RepID=UPI00301D7903